MFKEEVTQYCPMCQEWAEKYKAKEQECEGLKQGYAELTEIVSPYMDDFTGYNEELGGFDIVLCVKELLVQLDQLKFDYVELEKRHNDSFEQFKKLKAENDELKKIIKRLDVPKHEVIDMDIAFENEKLKQTLTEIRKIAQGVRNYLQVPAPRDVRYEMDIILQKISEVTNE